jgi:carboxylate-amine ligase
MSTSRKELKFLRTKIVELADKQGLIVVAPVHLFSKWQDQPITDDPRYHTIVNELQDAARSNLILECIVTWESKIEIGLKLMNQAYFCPIYLRFPLTPLWEGRHTGYNLSDKSIR